MTSPISYYAETDIPECRSLQREEYDVLEVGPSLLLAYSNFYASRILVHFPRVCFKPPSG
jgi:hypothetical protein